MENVITFKIQIEVPGLIEALAALAPRNISASAPPWLDDTIAVPTPQSAASVITTPTAPQIMPTAPVNPTPAAPIQYSSPMTGAANMGQGAAPAYASNAPIATQGNPAPAPTSAPTYAIEDIARAAGAFADTGEQSRAAVLNLMAQFGLQQLQALPAAQYGAFVMALRQLGAKI